MKIASFLLVLWFVALSPSNTFAWIFPEHRDIGREAIARLDKADREKLELIWKQANVSSTHRLCGLPSEPGEAPISAGTECADFAMLPALAGDHSCSPESLESTVLDSDWFPRLSRFAGILKQDLYNASSLDSKINIWNDSNVTLLKIDPAYLSRASTNYAHFPLAALPVSEHETLHGFMGRSTAEDAPMNAVGVYSRFHLAALAYARSGQATAAVMSETFALHFLQDLFASGHYAGTWGPAAERKGTHDYYCINGLVSQTWEGKRYSGHGDAFMTEDDLRHAAEAVTESLRQAPIPSEGAEGVSLPRFRIETGPFVSLSSGFRFGTTIGGISGSEEDGRSAQQTK